MILFSPRRSWASESGAKEPKAALAAANFGITGKHKRGDFIMLLELQRFTTAHLRPKDRHEAWTHRDWPSLAPIYRTKPAEPFDVVSDRLAVGGVVIQYADFSAQHWDRDSAMVRSFDPDHLVAVMTLEGLAEGTIGRNSFRTGAGDLQFVDLAGTSSHFSTASRTIALAVPRPVASERGLNPAALNGCVIRSGFARLLGSHLLGLRDAVAEAPVASAGLLQRGILDLLNLAAAGAAEPRGEAEQPKAGARIAARSLIERELVSALLTPGKLCRTLGISRSTLHRLFAEDGGVRAYIRRRRLEAVRFALSDPRLSDPIHVLAERFGFSDSAHLSRLFRSEYEITPSDYRARAREETGLGRPNSGRRRDD
jgi:AraC-like DNA-binding protein